MFTYLVFAIPILVIVILVYPLLFSVNDNKASKSNKIVVFAIVVFLPVFAILSYKYLGYTQLLNDSSSSNESIVASEKMANLLASIEQTINQHPEEVEARIALAQVYAEMERFSDAALVYEALHILRPDEPDFLVNYAEALARSHGNRLTGKPALLLEQALQLEPNHGRALWLSGFAAKQDGNKQKALSHWQHLLAGVEQGTEVYREIEFLVEQLESSDQTVKSDLVQRTIQVNVAVSDEVHVDPDTALFVFASAVNGPPMPLAVHRGIASDIPLMVVLDDSMAMMSQMSLSDFNEVIVVARLSRNGEPQGQAGDYEGISEPVILSSAVTTLDVLINQVKP